MPKAKQLTLWVADQPGMLGEIAGALGEKKTNIVAIMGATEGGRGAVRMVVDKPATARKAVASLAGDHSPAHVADQRPVGRHKYARHDKRLDVFDIGSGLLRQDLGQARRESLDDLSLARHQG